MKHDEVMTPQYKLQLTTICTQHNFTTQTKHNTIQLLINLCSQDRIDNHNQINYLLATIFISQKLH